MFWCWCGSGGVVLWRRVCLVASVGRCVLVSLLRFSVSPFRLSTFPSLRSGFAAFRPCLFLLLSLSICRRSFPPLVLLGMDGFVGAFLVAPFVCCVVCLWV